MTHKDERSHAENMQKAHDLVLEIQTETEKIASELIRALYDSREFPGAIATMIDMPEQKKQVRVPSQDGPNQAILEVQERGLQVRWSGATLTVAFRIDERYRVWGVIEQPYIRDRVIRLSYMEKMVPAMFESLKLEAQHRAEFDSRDALAQGAKSAIGEILPGKDISGRIEGGRFEGTVTTPYGLRLDFYFSQADGLVLTEAWGSDRIEEAKRHRDDKVRQARVEFTQEVVQSLRG